MSLEKCVFFATSASSNLNQRCDAVLSLSLSLSLFLCLWMNVKVYAANRGYKDLSSSAVGYVV